MSFLGIGSSTYDNAAAFPALGFNPAPGDLGTIDNLTAQLRAAAEELAQARHTLAGLAQPGGGWRGRAAMAFAQTVGELPGQLQRADQSTSQAGQAMNRWSNELARMQDQARMYEREAEAAKQRVQAAQNNPALDLGGGFLGLGGDLSPEQQAQLSQARAQLDAAQADLQRIIESARQLQETHKQVADQITRAVEDATGLAPDQSLLEWINGGLDWAQHKLQGLQQAFVEFCQQHKKLLDEIGDKLSVASGIFGMLALATVWFPPAAGVFAGASALLSAGALASHGMAKVGGAKVSATDLGMDALGAIPAAKMLTMPMRGIKLAGTTIKGLSVGRRATNLGVRLNKAAPGRTPVVGGGPTKGGYNVTPNPGSGLGTRLRVAGAGIADDAASGGALRRQVYDRIVPPAVNKTPLGRIPGAENSIMKAPDTGRLMVKPESWAWRGPQMGLEGAAVGEGVHDDMQSRPAGR